MDTALVDLVEQEQVEPPPGLLIPPQDQAFGPGVTSAAIRLDRDRLHIEEGQDGSAWAVMPPRPQPVQDPMPIGIDADYPYSYCSPCRKRPRSSGPAPMLGQRTDEKKLLTDNYASLFTFSPFCTERAAA
jgi:hypothetical protein